MTALRDSADSEKRSLDPVAGFLSGLLLMIPGVLPVLAPLQLTAFVPLLIVLRRTGRHRQRLGIGLLMGLGFVAPQVLLLRLPAPMALVLVGYFLVLITTFILVSSWIVHRASIWSALAFGASLAVLDWVNFTVLPMWGEAQSFVRCWSWYPRTIAFTSVTGITGIMFVLGTTQALGVTFALDRRRRVRSLAALIIVVGVVLGINAAILDHEPAGYLRVAAVGWESLNATQELGPETPDGFRRLYAERVAEGVGGGARLIVSPETAFAISNENEPGALAQFLDLARRHNVYLAIGYFDGSSQRNRVAFIGPTEGIMGQYTKTHLTPFEDYPSGTGDPQIIVVDEVKIGAMICQDDNYTDISRRYGVECADVVVIPTNDWGLVRNAHLQSTIHRAIESRFAVVRAASNGISAIISPDGRRLASLDHCRRGLGMIIADVPVYEAPMKKSRLGSSSGIPQMGTRLPRTPFSQFGHWFVSVCGVFLLSCLVMRQISHCTTWPLCILGANHGGTVR